METNISLWHSIEPSAFCLSLKPHLQPTMLVDVYGGTRDQVLFWSRALNSSCIAARHSGMRIALEKHVSSTKAEWVSASSARGIRYLIVPSVSCRYCTILLRDRVHIGWMRAEVGAMIEPDTFGSIEEAWDIGENVGIVCEDGDGSADWVWGDAGRKGGRIGAGEASRGSGGGAAVTKGNRFHEKSHLLKCTCGQTQGDSTCNLYG